MTQRNATSRASGTEREVGGFLGQSPSFSLTNTHTRVRGAGGARERRPRRFVDALTRPRDQRHD